MNTPAGAPARQRLFISYRHGAEDSPQEGIIRQVYDRFSARHDVFTDKDILPGSRWGEDIEREVGTCDVFVPLLTAEAMWSEMVIDEISRAHRLRRASGKPRMIPIRVKNKQDFPYPLSAYLNLIQWFSWDSEANTGRLLDILETILGGRAESGAAAPVPRTGDDTPHRPLLHWRFRPAGCIQTRSITFVARAMLSRKPRSEAPASRSMSKAHGRWERRRCSRDSNGTHVGKDEKSFRSTSNSLMMRHWRSQNCFIPRSAWRLQMT